MARRLRGGGGGKRAKAQTLGGKLRSGIGEVAASGKAMDVGLMGLLQDGCQEEI